MAETQNISNNSNDLCATSKLISDRKELQIIYYVECVLGLLALFPNLVTLNLLWRVKIFHANLRLILANLTCSLIIYSTTIIVKAFQRLTGNVCDFPMLLQPCILREFALAIPLHNALISVMILSLERLYATIRYRSYDFSNSTPYLGIFLIVCAWVSTFALNIPSYLNAPADYWIPVCETALVAHAKTVANMLITLLFFETTAAGLMTFVFLYNRYILKHMIINRALYNLSSRFQVNQNVQLNKALMPGIILHMLCHLPSYAFLCSIFVNGNMEISTKAWLLHLTYVWRLVYALVDPMLLIVLNPNLRNGLEKSVVGGLFSYIFRCFGQRKMVKTRDVKEETEKVMKAHFDYLRESWMMQKQIKV